MPLPIHVNFSEKMKNILWFLAFLFVGIAAALIAMAQALNGGWLLSVPNAVYSAVMGLLAGALFGGTLLLFRFTHRFSSPTAKILTLAIFAAGWYLAFYVYVSEIATV